MKKLLLITATLFIIIQYLNFPVRASAQTITLTPSADATIKDGTSDNHGAEYGLTSANQDGYYSFLMKFDFGVIPEGASIDSAILTITQTAASGDNATLNSYKVSSGWQEGTVNGSSKPTYDTGVVYGALSIDAVNGAKVFTQNFSGVVQDWVASPESNFGLYFLSVQAGTYRHEFGSRESISKPKLEVTFTTNGGTPLTISNIKVKNITQSSAEIVWETEKNASGFVDYGTDTNYGNVKGSGDFITIHSIGLTGLVPDTQYHYHIRVKDEDGLETISEDRIFTTKKEDAGGDSEEEQVIVSSILVPKNVKAFDLKEDGVQYIHLSWEPSDEVDITGYRIYKSVEDALSYNLLIEVTADVLEYDDRDVEEGKTYFYVIRTLMDGEESRDSNEAVVTLYSNQIEKELANISFWKGLIIFNVVVLPVFGVFYYRYKKNQSFKKGTKISRKSKDKK